MVAELDLLVVLLVVFNGLEDLPEAGLLLLPVFLGAVLVRILGQLFQGVEVAWEENRG